MEKRLLVAVLLVSAVIMLTNVLFPAPEKKAAPGGADTTAVAHAPRQAEAPAAAAPSLPAAPIVLSAPADTAPARSVVVSSGLYRYSFSTRGAALVAAELLDYPSYTGPGLSQLVPAGVRDLFAHRLVAGGDTLDLRAAHFEPSADSLRVTEATGPKTLRFTYAAPNGLTVEIDYTFQPGRYAVKTTGRVTALPAGAKLLTELGPNLAPSDPVTSRSEGQMALVTRTSGGDLDRERISKIEGLDTLGTSVSWVAMKDKYFLAAQVAGDSVPFSIALAHQIPPVSRVVVQEGDTTTVSLPRARVVTALPLGADGRFAYTLYAGPQEYHQLDAVGYNLPAVTKYAYAFLEPIIRPFVALILNVLEFFHTRLGMAYGWVLVLFGVLMRIVYWPFNAKAMRSQMKNAAFAPLMKEIKEKYKDDPKKQQEEMVRMYREHGVNPVSGCLPMLIPYPVLITLFFVFENTIAFRGESFLWIPDLSLMDPYYILPVLLIVSMFALQVVSMKISGTDQNPQMKIMMYVMPLVMGFIFFQLPSGLNVYYVVTNVASMPQQLLLARERKTLQAKQEAEAAEKKAALRPAPGLKKGRKK